MVSEEGGMSTVTWDVTDWLEPSDAFYQAQCTCSLPGPLQCPCLHNASLPPLHLTATVRVKDQPQTRRWGEQTGMPLAG